jgi:hypothetical protein
MVVPDSVLDLVQPWATLYGDSPAVSLAVVFLHLAALMVGGGRALAADGDVLMTRGPETALFSRLRSAHRIVIPALVLSVSTGALMTAADLEHFAQSSAYQLKLLSVLLLLANGLWMRINEHEAAAIDGGAAFGRLRLSAVMSATLWLLTLLAGCWLQVGG